MDKIDMRILDFFASTKLFWLSRMHVKDYLHTYGYPLGAQTISLRLNKLVELGLLENKIHHFASLEKSGNLNYKNKALNGKPRKAYKISEEGQKFLKENTPDKVCS